MQYIIYALKDPVTKEIRYIGKSASGLKRPQEHLKPKEYNKHTHKAHWVKSLILRGLQPEIEVLLVLDSGDQLDSEEIRLIAEYRAAGAALTNATDGGEGALGRKVSEETRQKVSEKKKAYYASLEGPIEAPNKKAHVFIEGVECKECATCKQTLPLASFGSNSARWDKLHVKCKTCHRDFMRAQREANPHQKLSAEELAQSYIDRAKNIKAALKEAMTDELKAKYAAAKKKPIKGVSPTSTVKFASAKDAKIAGFDSTNIGKAIKNNTPYRGYMWSFDTEET